MHLTLIDAPGVQRLTYLNMPQWLVDYFEAFKDLAVATEASLPKELLISNVELHFKQFTENFLELPQMHIEMECFEPNTKAQVDIWGSSPISEAHRKFFGIDNDAYVLKLLPGQFAELAITTPFTPLERPHFKMQQVDGAITITTKPGTGIVSMCVTPQHTITTVDGVREHLHVIEFVGEARVTAENPNPIPSFEGMEFIVLTD